MIDLSTIPRLRGAKLLGQTYTVRRDESPDAPSPAGVLDPGAVPTGAGVWRG